MAYDENRKVRRPSVLPKVLLGGFAVFTALGSFWGMIWFVRSMAEPPRIAVLKPAALAASESRPAPVKAQAATPPQAAIAAPARPTDGLADRWSPIETARSATMGERPQPASKFTEEPKPVANPLTKPVATVAITPPAPPAPPATAPAQPQVIGSAPPIAGPVPLPRRRPNPAAMARVEASVPTPRPRPETAPETPPPAAPIGPNDERYPPQ